jgi:hypothetical protein
VQSFARVHSARELLATVGDTRAPPNEALDEQQARVVGFLFMVGCFALRDGPHALHFVSHVLATLIALDSFEPAGGSQMQWGRFIVGQSRKRLAHKI